MPLWHQPFFRFWVCTDRLLNSRVEHWPTLWESEAPAELTTQWFGRSLTLPSSEWVEKAYENMFTGVASPASPPEKSIPFWIELEKPVQKSHNRSGNFVH